MASKGKISKLRGTRGFRAVCKPKLKPRGRAFPKGNKLGNRFPKGVSGNPSGRPASAEVSRASRAWLAAPVTLEELLANRLPAELFGMSHAEVVAWLQGQDAMRGNLSAAEFVADRAEGKPHVAMNINEGPNPLLEMIRGMDALAAKIGPPEMPPGFYENDEEKKNEQ